MQQTHGKQYAREDWMEGSWLCVDSVDEGNEANLKNQISKFSSYLKLIHEPPYIVSQILGLKSQV